MTTWTLETTGTLRTITRFSDRGLESTIDGLEDQLRRRSEVASEMFPTPTSAAIVGGVTDAEWCAVATTQYLAEVFGRRYLDAEKTWTDSPIRPAPAPDSALVY